MLHDLIRKKGMRVNTTALLLAAILLLTACGGGDGDGNGGSGQAGGTSVADSGQTYTWRLQCIYNLETMQGYMATQIKEELEAATNGRLQIEIYPPGGLAPAEDALTYLSRETFEMMVSMGNNFSGILPEADLEAGLPFAWESFDEIYDAMERRGLGDLIQEAYDELGVNWYWTAHEPNYNTLTNFEVTGLDSYKGKKIRALGIWGKFYEKLGATPTVIAGPEVYQALQLGTIDGAHYGWSSLKDNNLTEVVDYCVYPSDAFIAMSILVNQDALNKLPDDLRAVVESTCRNAAMGPISGEHQAHTKEGVYDAIRSGAVTPVYLSDSDVETMRMYAVEVWDEWADKSDRMAKGVEIIKQQSRDYGRRVDF